MQGGGVSGRSRRVRLRRARTRPRPDGPLRRTARSGAHPHRPDGSGAVLVDATLGAAGHAERFLTEFPALRLIGLDRDPNALAIATARLAWFGDRVTLVPDPL